MGHDTTENAEVRRESEAVANARGRISDLAGKYGTNHPEYATSLNQLALLLIMQGDPRPAEPLLRQALEIRRRALGALHPDYATNLSSLGGLLWAGGDFDQAEPMLREALEVRTETLGPRHPKSVVSLNSLEQLLKAKRDAAGSPPPFAPPTRAQPPVVEARVANPKDVAGAEQIDARLDRLRLEFAALGDRLTKIGEGLRSGSVPTDDAIPAAWANARDGFARLRRDAVAAAEAHAVSVATGVPASLADLAALTPAVRAAEAARAEAESGRAEALRLLDRVDGLRCPGDPAFPSLAACREQAQAYRRTIEGATSASLPDLLRPLSDGTHPLVILLKLVSADDSTTDSQWADWFDAVASAFGDALAVAVARSRIHAGVP